MDYKTDDLDLEKEERNTSDYSSIYIGGHMGIGRVYKINKRTNIDVSGKFLFMYQGEKDIKLSCRDKLKYGSIKSGRIRIGAKADYELSKRKLNKYKIKILVIFCLILKICSYSIMAQDIVIRDRVVNHDVYGNGTLATDGNEPLPVAPSNNSVIIQGRAGVSVGVVAGGADRAGDSEDVVSNTVVIDIGGVGEGDIAGEVYGGRGFGIGSNVISNRLRITRGNINGPGGSCGGFSGVGGARDNTMEVTGGTIGGDAYGGWGLGEAINNRLTITNGNINGGDGSFGGRSDNGIVRDNTMEMTGGTITNSAFGGYSNNGDAISNTLKISSGNIGGRAYGGYSVKGRVEGNVLEMLSGGAEGTITGDACGGYGHGEAINNRLRIEGGNINGGVGACGGYSNSGIARDNTMEVTGGTITGNAYGGQGLGEAINNSLRISGGNINGAIGACGGRSNTGIVRDNTMEMTGGMITANAYGGYGVGEAINNRLRIEGGNINGRVGACGGRSINGKAQGNTLEITGGTITKDAYGGYSNTGDAISNTLKISSGTIKGDVIGGRGSLDANENKVIISGGEILANVYGGRSINGGAVGNIIEISGDAKFSSTNTYIYGGYSDTAGKDTFTNNVFNIKKDNIEIAGMGGFQILNFYNPVKNGNAMIICADQVNVEGVNINADMNVDEDVDDKYILIRSNSGLDGSVKEVKVKRGVLSRYEASMFINNIRELGVVITRRYIDPRAEIITQSKAATLEIINEGLDLIVDKGIESAKDASMVAEGLVPFVAVKGGKSKISTGADINIEGIEVMGGVAKEINKDVTIGAFVEYGRKTSKLSEKIDFDKISADMTGDYKGLGVLIRADIFSNSYIEGSVRGGGYSVDFNADNIDQEKEERVSYDYNSMYLGGHAGVGYIYKVNDRVNIDMSSKFLFMHEQEKGLKLSCGDNLKILNLETGKVRVGANIDYKLAKEWRPYIGINYDYEVIGKKVEAKTIDIELPAVEVRRGRFSGQ
ncbi:MAG: autotransporter outer membrane beta-barrel domain-containing protein, partial [Endomicrobium sp.]|nr:autotransporter outer membrane beta-barrel domain-containing protein [Endomicrobium sp.]